MDEKVRFLQESLALTREDVDKKDAVIQHYFMKEKGGVSNNKAGRTVSGYQCVNIFSHLDLVDLNHPHLPNINRNYRNLT